MQGSKKKNIDLELFSLNQQERVPDLEESSITCTQGAKVFYHVCDTHAKP